MFVRWLYGQIFCRQPLHRLEGLTHPGRCRQYHQSTARGMPRGSQRSEQSTYCSKPRRWCTRYVTGSHLFTSAPAQDRGSFAPEPGGLCTSHVGQSFPWWGCVRFKLQKVGNVVPERRWRTASTCTPKNICHTSHLHASRSRGRYKTHAAAIDLLYHQSGRPSHGKEKGNSQPHRQGRCQTYPPSRSLRR